MRIILNSEDNESGAYDTNTIVANLRALHEQSKRGTTAAIESVSIPYTYFTVREQNKNLGFTITYDDTTSNFVKTVYPINGGIYGTPSVSTFVSDYNANAHNTANTQSITAALDPRNGRLTFSSTASFVFDFSQWPGAKKMLGFPVDTDVFTSSGNKIHAPNCVDFSYDKYITIRSSEPIFQVGDYNGQNRDVESCLVMRVPVIGAGVQAFGNVVYTPLHLDWKPTRQFPQQVRFELFDDDDQPLDLNGSPWQMTILVQ